MKAIIQSYTPQECERIINGRQTIKVCKNAPKDTPFKVYIYCISVKNMPLAKYVEVYKKTNGRIDCWHGKVIGEYVCEKVDVAEEQVILGGIYYSRYEDVIDCSLVEKSCLDNFELLTYGKGKPFSVLHISNVKIYDKPKELKEFGTFVNKQNIINKGGEVIIENWTEFVPMRRPHHGWQYVEEVQ